MTLCLFVYWIFISLNMYFRFLRRINERRVGRNCIIYSSLTFVKSLAFCQRDWIEITRNAKPRVSVEQCPLVRQEIMLT